MVTDTKGGVNSSDVQHRFEIVAPTLRISGRKVAEYLELGREGLKLSVQTTAHADAVLPDAYELDVTNEAGTFLGSLPVPVAGIVLWKGETKPGYGLGWGTFTLRITARTDGLVLARSTEHQIRVVDFYFDFISGTPVPKRELPAQLGRAQGSGPDRGPLRAPEEEPDRVASPTPASQGPMPAVSA